MHLGGGIQGELHGGEGRREAMNDAGDGVSERSIANVALELEDSFGAILCSTTNRIGEQLRGGGVQEEEDEEQ